MGLKEKVLDDLKNSMKARDEVRTAVLRMLKAAITQLEVSRTDAKNKDHGKPVTEADLLGVVEKQAKQRKESRDAYEKGGRPELAAREAAELAILEAYAPKQLSRDEIRVAVEAIMAELGAREFAKVMKEAAARLKGQADGRAVSEVVKEATAAAD